MRPDYLKEASSVDASAWLHKCLLRARHRAVLLLARCALLRRIALVCWLIRYLPLPRCPQIWKVINWKDVAKRFEGAASVH